MTTIRIFGLSLLFTTGALAIGYWHGGPTALFLLVVLAVLEVSLSFDNAIINAAILKQMSRFWQQMFLTVGILIAVFGMRLVFPLAIVWVTAGLDPVHAMDLALNPPPNGALEFPDGSPSYEKLIKAAHPQIAAFGGMFLLMLFLDFVFHDRDIKWLKWIEAPFARVGRLGQVPVVVACVALVLVGTELTHSGDERANVLIAGLLGLVIYLVVNGLSRAFRPRKQQPTSGERGPSAKPASRSSSISRCSMRLFPSTVSPEPSRSPATRSSLRWASAWWAPCSSGRSPSIWSAKRPWTGTYISSTARIGRSGLSR
ncbi:integral membrane TerC family protein [Mycobacterium kansasii]|uniref:Integral membrane TerC family protein n=1 Tax=Mycobacterium kansasii TaxID=1768 RepID=A0A1V3X8B5_MYCKA|nr:integral membrane TerC family protein [Mycobacterium kansasii]